MIERDATSTRATVPASAFATKATSVRSGDVGAADTLSVRHAAIDEIVAARICFIFRMVIQRCFRMASYATRFVSLRRCWSLVSGAFGSSK